MQTNMITLVNSNMITLVNANTPFLTIAKVETFGVELDKLIFSHSAALPVFYKDKEIA